MSSVSFVLHLVVISGLDIRDLVVDSGFGRI